MSKTTEKISHLFIDGPNIDATLGNSILGHKPMPRERPRWNLVLAAAQAHHGVEQPCFVLNGDKFDFLRAPFYRALKLMRYDVATPMTREWCDHEGQDPVDEFIKYQIEDLAPLVETGEVEGVLIASHDHGFAPALRMILAAGGFVRVVGFKEWMAPALVELESEGAVLLDLEHDFCAFNVNLDRPRFAA